MFIILNWAIITAPNVLPKKKKNPVALLVLHKNKICNFLWP